jgi:predicted nucleic acid-binding protein
MSPDTSRNSAAGCQSRVSSNTWLLTSSTPLPARNVLSHASLIQTRRYRSGHPESTMRAVFDTARRIARTHTAHLGTRTLDVLHVASALILGATDFYTFDKNQRKLARIEGLKAP